MVENMQYQVFAGLHHIPIIGSGGIPFQESEFRQMQASALYEKAPDFPAVYIGFRCAKSL